MSDVLPVKLVTRDHRLADAQTGTTALNEIFSCDAETQGAVMRVAIYEAAFPNARRHTAPLPDESEWSKPLDRTVWILPDGRAQSYHALPPADASLSAAWNAAALLLYRHARKSGDAWELFLQTTGANAAAFIVDSAEDPSLRALRFRDEQVPISYVESTAGPANVPQMICMTLVCAFALNVTEIYDSLLAKPPQVQPYELN